jgi:hypothetical protein
VSCARRLVARASGRRQRRLPKNRSVYNLPHQARSQAKGSFGLFRQHRSRLTVNLSNVVRLNLPYKAEATDISRRLGFGASYVFGRRGVFQRGSADTIKLSPSGKRPRSISRCSKLSNEFSLARTRCGSRSGSRSRLLRLRAMTSQGGVSDRTLIRLIDLTHGYGRYGFRRITCLRNEAGSFAYNSLALMTGPGSAHSAASSTPSRRPQSIS